MLVRDGHEVTMFERFEAPRPIGSGPMMQQTGQAALRTLGLDGAIETSGALALALRGRTGWWLRGRGRFGCGGEMFGCVR